MRIIQIDGLKRGGGKVRQLHAATWPKGAVIAVELGADKGTRTVRWLNLADSKELFRRDLPTKEGPNAALSSDLTILGYLLRDAGGDMICIEKANEPKRARVGLYPWGEDEFEDHEGDTYLSLAISSDKQMVRASINDGDFVGWEIGEAFEKKSAPSIYRTMRTGSEFGPAICLAFAPNSWAALGTSDGYVHLSDEGGNPTDAMDQGAGLGAVGALAFGPDSKFVVAAIGDVVRAWRHRDEYDHKQIYALSGHKGSVQALAFSPDGKTLATGSTDGTVRFWDAANGQSQKSWDWKIGKIGGLAFSPDGFTCIAGGDRGRIVVWDLDD